MSSAIYCNHANEVPLNCTCPEDCYCKTHTCKLLCKCGCRQDRHDKKSGFCYDCYDCHGPGCNQFSPESKLVMLNKIRFYRNTHDCYGNVKQHTLDFDKESGMFSAGVGNDIVHVLNHKLYNGNINPGMSLDDIYKSILAVRECDNLDSDNLDTNLNLVELIENILMLLKKGLILCELES